MNRFIYLLILAATTPIAGAQVSSLAEAERVALSENPEIRAAEARYSALARRPAQERAWDDPEVGADVERGGTRDFAEYSDVEYMASQRIPVSGKNRVRGRIAEFEAAMALQDFRRVKLDVLNRVRSMWLEHAGIRARLRLLEETEALYKQLQESTQISYETGAASQGEIIGREIDVAKISEQRTTWQGQLATFESEFNAALNRAVESRSIGTGTLPKIDTVRYSQKLLEEKANALRPEILRAQELMRANRERISLAGRAWIPDPQLRVEARQFDGQGGIQEYDTGIFFSVPWVNAKKYRAAKDEAVLNHRSAEAELQAAQIQAQGMIRSQLAKLDALRTNYLLYRDNLLPKTREALAAARVRYESAESDIALVISANASVRDLEMKLIEYQAAWLIAASELKTIVGELPDSTVYTK